MSQIEQSIKRKIESIGTPLSEWDINIYRGVLTGYNEAFIISTEKREEILASCKNEGERSRTAELIRPILRGRDIKRYSYNWADLWIINTHNGIKGKIDPIQIEEYPAVKNYLNQHWDRLSKRDDQGITPYNLRNCAYLEDFDKPKIMWKRIGSILRFSYDETGVIGLDSTCFATGESLAFICCVLNSKMGHYLLKDAPKTGTGDLLISVQAVNPVRIPKDLGELEEFKELLAKQIQKPSDDVENIINEKVFNLYDLTDEEKIFIKEYVTLFE